MTRQSPLRDRLLDLGAMLDQYGEGGPDLCQALAPIELEYAAIRAGCAAFDDANRTFIEVRGTDRLEFLNRMLTQELKGIEAGDIRESFWLNRKGRIDADMRVMELGDRTLLEVDSHAGARAMETLSEYLFAEDVSIEDAGGRLFKLSLHGPSAPAALSRLVSVSEEDLRALGSNRLIDSSIEGEPILLAGDQLTGEMTIACIAPASALAMLFDRLIEIEVEGKPVRPIGWQALNMARIEAGNPLFMLDFGPRSLPAETGLLDRRVSFTKGCYLGQEIVARMNSLGQPKKTLVALRLESSPAPAVSEMVPEIPETGAPVRVPESEKDIGAITSATLSPMLARTPIAFAMVRWQHREPTTKLTVQIDEGWLSAIVQQSLEFWRP